MSVVDIDKRHLSTGKEDFALIVDSAHLADWCRKAAQHEVLALDTEFYRDTVYWPQLCLIQACHAGGAAIIDPLAAGLELAPFQELLANRGILKILHACRQDMEIFTLLGEEPPAPVFDTQIAAQALGFPANSGYGTLASAMTKVKIDKAMQMSDWRKRPLSERQLHYALQDVVPLLEIWHVMDAQLRESGRHAWVAPEMEKLSDRAAYVIEPESCWQRMNLNARTEEEWISMAALTCWREEEAQKRDCPRGWILREDALKQLARARPKNMKDLAAQRSVPKQILRNGAGGRLLQALSDRERFRPHWLAKKKQKKGNVRREEVQLLQMVLNICATEAGAAPSLIATSEELEMLALEREAALARMAGWRRKIFGEPALALMRGEAALGFADGQATLLETGSNFGKKFSR